MKRTKLEKAKAFLETIGMPVHLGKGPFDSSVDVLIKQEKDKKEGKKK